eukprot:332517_1
MKSTSCRRKQTRNQRNKLNKKKKNINITKKKNNAKLAPTDKLKHIKAKQLNSNSEFVGSNTKPSLCIKGMDEINDYIHEYLVFHAYDLTIEYFEKERITNSYTQSKIEDNLMNTNIVNNDELRNEILQKIIIMFDANDINGILKLLNRYLSKDTLNNNSNAIKIECHLHIFKFVTKMNRYKKKKNLNKNCIQNLNVIRSELQKYFNDNGQRLALCQDALPYFSLPYIDNAQTHPVFSHFYQPKFAHELRSQLTGCILKSIDNISVPKLHSIFAISKQKQTDIQNNNLTKILRITSEFVNSMQYCLNNNLPPTSAMINDCKQKMSMIANNILRKSKRNEIEIIDSNGNIPSIQYENDIKQLETLQLKKPIMQSENQMKTQLENQIQLNINYNKLHKQLNNSNVSIDEQIKLLLLLQSLRWRITNLIKHNDKRTIVIEYIKNDIFELQCNNENK